MFTIEADVDERVVLADLAQVGLQPYDVEHHQEVFSSAILIGRTQGIPLDIGPTRPLLLNIAVRFRVTGLIEGALQFTNAERVRVLQPAMDFVALYAVHRPMQANEHHAIFGWQRPPAPPQCKVRWVPNERKPHWRGACIECGVGAAAILICC